MSKTSVPQKSFYVTYEFDEFGWPIDPATGEAFRYSQIVTDPTLPLPKHADPADPYWQRRDPKQTTTKKARSRSTQRTTRRNFSAASVLKHLGLSSVERQRRETAAATTELVDRANGDDERSILLMVPEGWKVVA